MKAEESIVVATIGRTVGLRGDLKLHLYTDFPEQFRAGVKFHTEEGELEVLRYDANRQVIAFLGYTTPERARLLTNLKLYTTLEESRKNCALEEGEHFWFDIIGLEVIEEDSVIGRVAEIERLGGQEMLFITTTDALIAEGLPKSFVLPYVDHFIDRADIAAGKIFVRHARDVLEAS